MAGVRCKYKHVFLCKKNGKTDRIISGKWSRPFEKSSLEKKSLNERNILVSEKKNKNCTLKIIIDKLYKITYLYLFHSLRGKTTTTTKKNIWYGTHTTFSYLSLQ